MKLPSAGLALALGLLCGAPLAQEPGSKLKSGVQFDEVVGLPIVGLDHLAGRAVLIEFFAYW